MKKYKIGDLSRILELSQKRIRDYEKAGFIRPERDANTNDRLYTEFEIQQIKRVKKLIHNHGFTLSSLKYLLDLTPCWMIFNCRDRKDCIAYSHPESRCWEATDMNKDNVCYGDCNRCVIYLASKKLDNKKEIIYHIIQT